jgi:ribosome-binding factor A
MRRVNTAIGQVVAEAIQRDLADPRLGFVTVTGAEASTDLRAARVYFTVLEAGRRRASEEALEAARGLLQARVAAELRTRNTPHLRFVYDETPARGLALTRLIDEVTGSPSSGTTPTSGGEE